MNTTNKTTPEHLRLHEDERREKNWKRWGPYLSERQWGTVREDYSEGGDCWRYFPHDHARSRAYRWGEDGLLGICDRQARFCFALALHNGRDRILKERLFGLTGPEGNHGEDVKELYYYLDATPTSSYLKGLYKYPQAPYPYGELVEENAKRGRNVPEFELIDTGVLEGERYFDIECEYAKASPEDILVTVTISNRGAEPASLSVLPTVWFRNTWSWGIELHEKPWLERSGESSVSCHHPELGEVHVFFESAVHQPELLFTENETNAPKLYGSDGDGYYKDAFHDYVVEGRPEGVQRVLQR